jgi:predicted transcriptional regulator
MKDKKLPPLSIRFEPDVKAVLDRLAKEQDRSVAWLVNSALRVHFTREKLLTSRSPKAGSTAG